jgi:hypothetical protein
MGLKVRVVGALLTLANAASAQEPVWVQDGFMTGEAYLSMDADSQANYAMGVIDGLILSPLVGAPPSKIGWLQGCLANMSGTQVAAILKKQVQDHPESWHRPAHTQMYSALVSTCPNSPIRESTKPASTSK